MTFSKCYFLKRDNEKIKQAREREEKLMVTAWYEMVSVFFMLKLTLITIELTQGGFVMFYSQIGSSIRAAPIGLYS